ncbi:MAG: septation regulator SpoVG [bacterium]
MEITDVRIFLRDEAKLKGYATVTFDSCFVIHNLRVIEGKNGLFVAMPSRKKKDGTHQDIAHPITPEMRKKIEDAVLGEFKKTVAEQPAAAQPESPPDAAPLSEPPELSESA